MRKTIVYVTLKSYAMFLNCTISPSARVSLTTIVPKRQTQICLVLKCGSMKIHWPYLTHESLYQRVLQNLP